MNTLKELVNKVYSDLQKSDWINQYPDLSDKDVVAEIIQSLALEMMPNFVEKNKLEEFVEESEKIYKEETFKKYIANYSEFLDSVEKEFYK
jgi:beta-xylosidase